MDIFSVINQAKKFAKKASKFDTQDIYYSYSDVSIIPTILTCVRSRSEVDTNEIFTTLQGTDLSIFPVFGASQSYMRSNCAKDLAKGGAIHVLPRVGLTEKDRISDIVKSKVNVGVAIGLKDSLKFIKQVIKYKNVKFLSLDIAHAASTASVEFLASLRALEIESGVIVGTVGSVEGFAFLYRAMKLLGYKNTIFRLGIGAGASCLTRINTGVGVGQFTHITNINKYISTMKLKDVKTIIDGGITCPGDLVKALTKCNAAMSGRYLASESFEKNVIVKIDGETKIKYFGMSTELAKGHGKYIEGGVTYQKLNGKRAYDVIEKMRHGLQSALTYTDSQNLNEFKKNAKIAINSLGAIRESGTH